MFVNGNAKKTFFNETEGNCTNEYSAINQVNKISFI